MTVRAVLAYLVFSTAAFADTVTLQPSASPSAAQPGVSVTLTGSGFPTGTINASQTQIALQPAAGNAGPSVSVSATTVTLVTGTTRRVVFTVPASLVLTAATPYQLTISGVTASGTSFQSGNAAALTMNPAPSLLSVNPSSGTQGQAVAILITGRATSFVQGATTASFGPGISVGGGQSGAAGPVTVTSATTATATLAIDAAAALGVRTVTIQTGTQQVSLANAFTVAAGAPQSSVVTLNASASPASAISGAQVSMSGTGFPVGTINLSAIQVELDPQQTNAGSSLRTTATSITPASGAVRTITFTIPTTLNVPAPISYLVSVAGATTSGAPFASSNKSALTITPVPAAPTLTSLVPSSGLAGQSLSLTITGQNTHFAAHSTSVNLGAGITVTGITVTSPTSMIVAITIALDASTGPRSVVVLTGIESITLSNSFQVTNPVPATLISAAPSVVNSGASVPVTIIGSNTNFKQGVTTVSFGGGITAGVPIVTSLTNLTVQATVDQNTAPGPRGITVTTGGETATLASGFAVAGPRVTITAPSNLSFVNAPSITVSGTVGDSLATVAVNGVNAPNSAGSFTTAVPLSEGNNTITAVATSAGGATATASVQVTLDTTPPHLAILSPPLGVDTSDSTINVSGLVNDIVVGTVNDQQAQVTVNGVAAQVSNRSFLASNIPLTLGTNTIQVVARDRVGNVATATLTLQRVASMQIRAISGNGQSGSSQNPLAAPLVVEVRDSTGRLAANQSVVFKITGNDGTLSLTPSSGTGKGSIVATTNGQGRAQVYWVLGSRAGAGSNQMEATSPTVVGAALFTATGISGLPAKILADSGLNQTGATGDLLPLPFVAVVTDSGNNRLAGIQVKFTVQQGGGTINGSSLVTVTTDGDGRAAVTLRLGSADGVSNNLVLATFGNNPGLPAVFSASGFTPHDPLFTQVSGVVLNAANHPLGGATVHLLQRNSGGSSNLPIDVATASATDSNGQFLLDGAPPGVYKLLVDGTTIVGASYPTLEFDITTVAGRQNTIGMPIYLPVLDTQNRLCVSPTVGGTLRLPKVPGFALTVAPNSATFPGGAKTGCVSVTPVNLDKVPMVPGFGQQPRFVVTIQPVGTVFSPPAQITIPNVDGLAPRAVTELYSYDHDLAAFVSIGSGTVSADGLTITSNPASGVVKAGWHCGGNPLQTGSVAECPQCYSCSNGMCAPDNSASCSDDNYCTSCDGETPGPDCCSGGNCHHKSWEKEKVTVKLSNDVSGALKGWDEIQEKLAAIEGFTSPLNALGCNLTFSPPEPEIESTTGHFCCEKSEQAADGTRIKGSISFSGGGSCQLLGVTPAAVAKWVRIASVGVTANASLSAYAQTNQYACSAAADSCEWGITAKATAGAYADLVKLGDALEIGIDFTAFDGSYGATCDCLLACKETGNICGELVGKIKIVILGGELEVGEITIIEKHCIF